MDYERILKYSEKQDLKGTLPDWQGMASVTEPSCGDTLTIWIKTYREVVTELRYTITETACPPVKACAAMAAEMALGKPVMEAYLIDAARISDSFGGLDKENYHCALMAELAVKKTIRDYAARRAQS